MPKDKSTRMCDEIGLIKWQLSAEKTQALECAEIPEGLFRITIDRDCKRGLISKQSQKYQVVFIDEFVRLCAIQQLCMWRIATNQAAPAPHGDKTSLGANRRLGQPIGVLATFAAAVDESTCEYVVIFHARSLARKQARRVIAARA